MKSINKLFEYASALLYIVFNPILDQFHTMEMDSDKCAQSKCGNIVDPCVYKFIT